jgi:hypothetical protein
MGDKTREGAAAPNFLKILFISTDLILTIVIL